MQNYLVGAVVFCAARLRQRHTDMIDLTIGYHMFLGVCIPVAAAAAVLLVVTNFLLARTISVWVERLASNRAGAFALLLALLCIPLLASLPDLPHSVAGRQFVLPPSVWIALNLTPPFAAARVLATTARLASFGGLAQLVLWSFLLATLLVLSERLPIVYRNRKIGQGSTAWSGPCDRVATFFGSSAPLVSKT
jgi:hypothetical protein